MAMAIANNLAAMSALGEASKNNKALGKAIKKAASGMKINSAGDDASGYSITERMRVRLRALEQDSRNVENGASLLRTAEGAIQSQVNLMRTIKAKVLDANNDTNTDADREIIQKEIFQFYDEINDIASETTFNEKHLLLGNTVKRVVESWRVLDHAVLAEGSDGLNLFPDSFKTLDGQEGPFDTFGSASDNVPYDGYNLKTMANPTALPGAGVQADNKLHDGTANTGNTLEIDLSSYGAIPSSLENTSFSVTSPYLYNDVSGTLNYFVLTTNTSNNYNNASAKKIDISGCTTVAQVADKIKAALTGNSNINSSYDVSVEGGKIKLQAKIKTGMSGTDTNKTARYNLGQYTMTGGTSGGGTTAGRTGAPATGLSLGSFSGGANEVGHYKTTETKNPDDSVTTTTTWVVDSPAKKATNTINGISSVPDGSGITLHGYDRYGYSTTAYLVFKDGSDGLKYDSANGYYTIGKNYTGTVSLGSFSLNLSGGKLTLTSGYTGSLGNSSSISDGITALAPSTIPVTTYTATTPLAGSALVNTQSGKNGDVAHWDIDLSGYNTSDTDKAEELIAAYVGKSISHSAYSGNNYEFIDTGSDDGMDAVYRVKDSTVMDLNNVRTAVQGGATVSEAFSNLVKSKVSYSSLMTNAAGDVVGVQFNASVPGTEGNSQTISVKEGTLRSYTIDFNGLANPEKLDGNGFRFYCATDPSQWVNVAFSNGVKNQDDKPASGTATQDIETLIIDVSSVNSVEDLVNLVDEKLGYYLDNEYKHFFKVVSNPEDGTLTIYDDRRFTLLNRSDYPDKQEKGAKIGDGILDNVVKDKREVYVNRMVIQHTDKSSANINIEIPQTTLDHIYGYLKENVTMSDFSVMTKENRERLLGMPPEDGLIDEGINYLLDGQTLIGAQVAHMESADNNIIVSHENTTAAESVIRDADMAKAAMEFAKNNILTQSAQSMLSQANQMPQSVMSLLQ